MRPLKVLSCLFLLLFSHNALAQTQGVYEVNDVTINSSGKSPNEARTRAVSAGQRSAFVTLLNRLGVDQNIANNLNDEQIDDMVASKQIVDEKIAGNNYSATLNLGFSETFVKHQLSTKSDVKEPEEKVIGSYLIIPVKIARDRKIIWEDNNDWKVAFENVVKNNKISLIKIPKGDAEDLAMFNSTAVSEGSFNDFEIALDKYKVDAITFAFFDFDNIENKVNITLKTIYGSRTNQVRLDFVNVNQLTMTELVNKVAGKTVNYIIGNKDDGKIVGSNSSLNIDVLISDLGEWLTIKNRLENQNIISSLKVNSIAKDLVRINANYNNNNGEIISFFAKHNLFLTKAENGYFLSLKQQ